MTTHFFTEEFDVSNSSVFHRILWDDEDRILFFVFKNLTVSSRDLSDADDPHTIVKDYDNSWGRAWNVELRYEPVGPDVESGAVFEQRVYASSFTEQDEAETAESVTPEGDYYVSLSFSGLQKADALSLSALLMSISNVLHGETSYVPQASSSVSVGYMGDTE